MRDPGRIDPLLDLVSELWHIYPDWRFGQLIRNVLHPDEDRLVLIEDDVMADKLTAKITEYEENQVRIEEELNKIESYSPFDRDDPRNHLSEEDAAWIRREEAQKLEAIPFWQQHYRTKIEDGPVSGGVPPMIYDFTLEECKDLIDTLNHRIDCVSYEAKRQRLSNLVRKVESWRTYLATRSTQRPVSPNGLA